MGKYLNKEGVEELWSRVKDKVSNLEVSKADVEDLSNVLAEDVLDEQTFPDIDVLTREELKKDLFIDQWNAACGKYGTYNAETGFFELNGLTDITYDEAIRILLISIPFYGKSRSFYHTYTRLRTYIPYRSSGTGIDCSSMFQYENKLETVQFVSGYGDYWNVTNLDYAFSQCLNLREIRGGLVSITKASKTFQNCLKLESVQLKNLNTAISFQDSPLLSLKSLQYMVTNATNTSTITITVHPDVYAKLTDETNTEWHKVLTDAAAKNISFATEI